MQRCRIEQRNHRVLSTLGWWAQQDSNLRLPPCEGGTLPLSYAPQKDECDRICHISFYLENIIPLILRPNSLDPRRFASTGSTLHDDTINQQDVLPSSKFRSP